MTSPCHLIPLHSRGPTEGYREGCQEKSIQERDRYHDTKGVDRLVLMSRSQCQLSSRRDHSLTVSSRWTSESEYYLTTIEYKVKNLYFDYGLLEFLMFTKSMYFHSKGF